MFSVENTFGEHHCITERYPELLRRRNLPGEIYNVFPFCDVDFFPERKSSDRSCVSVPLSVIQIDSILACDTNRVSRRLSPIKETARTSDGQDRRTKLCRGVKRRKLVSIFSVSNLVIVAEATVPQTSQPPPHLVRDTLRVGVTRLEIYSETAGIFVTCVVRDVEKIGVYFTHLCPFFAEIQAFVFSTDARVVPERRSYRIRASLLRPLRCKSKSRAGNTLTPSIAFPCFNKILCSRTFVLALSNRSFTSTMRKETILLRESSSSSISLAEDNSFWSR